MKALSKLTMKERCAMSKRSFDNLKPVADSEEAREKGRRGGIRSGESRRQRKALRETIQMAMETEYQSLYDDEGLNGKPLREAIALKLVKQASHGNLVAIKILLSLESEPTGSPRENETDPISAEAF